MYRIDHLCLNVFIIATNFIFIRKMAAQRAGSLPCYIIHTSFISQTQPNMEYRKRKLKIFVNNVSAYYILSVPCDCFLLCHFYIVFYFLCYVAITE